MKTVLLTGFEPFGGDPINPSWEIAQALEGRCIDGAEIRACRLPTRFGSAPERLREAVELTRPMLVIALGLASGRAEISLERVAINLIDARIPDNDGQQPHDQPVRADAPPAYFSTLPLKPMLAGLRAAGVPAGLSLSAGAFVCNQVFFELQHLGQRTGLRSGFIHVPMLPKQAASQASEARLPGMALSAQTDAIALAISLALQVPVQAHTLDGWGGADPGSPVA